jgi:antitoxin protein of toxin-antitoxin system
MGIFDEAKEKAEGLLSQHGDKAEAGLDKAGEIVDEKTGGKYSDQIDTGVDKATEAMQRLGGDDDR